MLHIISIELTNTLHLFARGGGGGSGGGGGGGGGGSGGSGSGGGSAIVLLGYVPTHAAGAFFRRKLHNGIGLTLTVLITVLYGSLWAAFGGLWIIVAICAYVGGPVGYFGLLGKVSARITGKAKKDMLAAAIKDPAWNEATLQEYVKKTFLDFQNDWSSFNAQHMRTYLTEEYANHVQLMLVAIQQRQRRNAVENPQLLEANPIKVEDFDDNSQDSVTYYIHGQANDKLLESINAQETLLFTDNSDFYEYWNFKRNGSGWLLAGISQMTEDAWMVHGGIKSFAEQNNMYFSPDWGWLLLPRRGVLFGQGKFGVSDINNHVIGMYKTLLVELYTYVPNPKGGTNVAEYLIAQVALPKRYDSLIVEAKESRFNNLFARTPKGYNKLSLEWADFNKRYNVYATNVEQVTAFELLHPVYMEKLFALPFKVSIEVVDNVVYLYTKDKKADYPTMYSILKDAFEEMKL